MGVSSGSAKFGGVDVASLMPSIIGTAQLYTTFLRSGKEGVSQQILTESGKSNADFIRFKQLRQSRDVD